MVVGQSDFLAYPDYYQNSSCSRNILLAQRAIDSLKTGVKRPF